MICFKVQYIKLIQLTYIQVKVNQAVFLLFLSLKSNSHRHNVFGSYLSGRGDKWRRGMARVVNCRSYSELIWSLIVPHLSDPDSANTVNYLISWHFEPSQLQRITLRLKTMFNLSSIHCARKLTNHKLSTKKKKKPTKSVLTQTYTRQNTHKHQRRISPFGITHVKKSTYG